ncbi:MAG TPA: TRAP transporter substrate-binding protein DctP [Desulfatiglandales bacterium]|nr:TRAP transporter substrate-binding protein DctP [Desulfatiglandales bacterium]
MSKKLSAIVIGIVCVFLIATLFPAVTSAAGKTLRWRMPVLYPRGTAFTQIYHGFCEDVNVMSGGRLVIEDIYDGEGVPATEIFSAVKSGLAEMGAPYMALHAGELPAGIIELILPGGPANFDELRALFTDPEWVGTLEKAYAKHGIYRLGEYFQGDTYMLTKKPINSLDDLKKMKFRAPAAYGKMVRYLGASPVVTAFSEVYTSLATGVVDGAAGNPFVDLRDGKWYEVAKYLYPLTITGTQVAPIIVNMDRWNELPDDLKAILKIACYKTGGIMRVKTLLWGKEAYDEMGKAGVKWSPQPSQTDVKRWNEAARSVWPEYAAKDELSKELIGIQEAFLKKMRH